MKTNLGAEAGTSRRSAKSDSAFRTISEAAKELGLQQHVLRFWESKFPQIQPMKRAGGRRYYRPEDIDFLSNIRSLLHDQGFTIKGVQKLLDQNKGKLPSEISVSAAEVDQAAFASDSSSKMVAEGHPVSFDKSALKSVLDELQELQGILRVSLQEVKKNP
ncbi:MULTISPECIES: MerR family transcriptional regulator [Thalassospira]|uniref:MerR family transcriptional regulator n=2 Tax=Thalassospira TaxID=168934 RepID=A0A367W4V3_9PROT|nr:MULTISPECIES: MerR family transcriptional regulator [Thalassospira]MDG4719671.1 MerR family transcriptional regulator [Thalassospira sp. FZY0004]RCK36289.1 MerR family transcriptional regulator [Thalassospira profundimaris]